MDDRTEANLFTRDDTLFGVCEALGQDFGINPNYIRVAFATGLLFNAGLVFAAYIVIGLVVAATRWISPSRAAAKQEAAAKPVATAPAEAPIEYALAA